MPTKQNMWRKPIVRLQILYEQMLAYLYSALLISNKKGTTEDIDTTKWWISKTLHWMNKAEAEIDKSVMIELGLVQADGGGGETPKRSEGVSFGGCILYFDSDAAYLGAYMCQNSLN